LVIVELKPWEYEWASHVGIRRFIENWEKSNAKHYDEKRMEDNRTAQVAACIAEIAVAKHVNRFWSGTVWKAQNHEQNKNRADVGLNIEVKRLRTRQEAPVRRHQLKKGLILWVAKPIAPEFRVVELYGYINYDQAWEIGQPSDYDPENTRLVSIKHLSHAVCCGVDAPILELLNTT